MFLHPSFNFKTLLFILMAICTTGRFVAAEQNVSNAIDFIQLKEYAVLASVAYQPEAEVVQVSNLKHYQLSRYRNIPELEVAYFLLTNDQTRTQLIVVRGTSNIENALLNVDLKLKADARTGIRLHTGFSQAAENIYRDIKPLLKPGYAINTTGHSLGGAVALIVAMYLDVDHLPIKQVVTFGQPKITNITGAGKFSHLNILRVVTAKDLVPLVPFLDPLDINDLNIYWHVGKEVILLPGIDYAILAGVESMLRATRFTQEPLAEENLGDHQMSLYLEMINKKILRARMVPFKTDFNLFNLFGDDTK